MKLPSSSPAPFLASGEDGAVWLASPAGGKEKPAGAEEMPAGAEAAPAGAEAAPAGGIGDTPTAALPLTLQRLRRSHYATRASLTGSVKDHHLHGGRRQRRRWRFAPSLPAALGLGFATLLLVAALVVRTVTPALHSDAGSVATMANLPGSAPTAHPQGNDNANPSDAQTPAPPSPAKGTLSDSGSQITIYISGAVTRPGVVTIQNGARLHQALEQVGGLTDQADARSVNLAAILTDAQHIHVPAVGEAPIAESTASNAGPGCVNVLTASESELQQLNGVGPALAARIVQARSDGALTQAEQIREVSGIGPKKYAQMEGQLCK